MKACKKCKKEKRYDEFYINVFLSDGFSSNCKDCCRKAARENRIKNIERYTEYDLNRRDDKNRKQKRKEYSARFRKEHPDKCREQKKRYIEKNKHKHFALQKLNKALQAGKIIKEPCKICGNKKSEGHHPDYNKPLSVVWLCRDHHKLLHRKDRGLYGKK